MEDARKNHNILLTVIGVTTLLVAMVGATFAYFSATSKSTEQQITTGNLKVSSTSSVKNNQNIRPTNWDGEDEGDVSSNTDVAVVDLTVDTTGTTIKDATYDIYLDATGIKLNDTKVKVEENGKDQELNGGSLSDIKWALFDEENSLGSGDFSTASADVSGNVTNLKVNNIPGDSITITPGDDTHKYKLYIWIQDNSQPQNKLQGLTIGATLRVDAKYGL